MNPLDPLIAGLPRVEAPLPILPIALPPPPLVIPRPDPDPIPPRPLAPLPPLSGLLFLEIQISFQFNELFVYFELVLIKLKNFTSSKNLNSDLILFLSRRFNILSFFFAKIPYFGTT